MRYRQISPARSWLMLQNEMKWMLERDSSTPYLEPWKRLPIDPNVEHIVIVEAEAVEDPWRLRVTCSCGLDRGLQAPVLATQDADWHRAEARRLKAEQGLDGLPIPMIERKQGSPEPMFRRICDHCLDRTGAWLLSEPVAALSSMLHFLECEESRKKSAAEAEQRRLTRRRRH